MKKSMFNIKLLVLMVCLSSAWVAFAQTDFTVNTYNATATTASTSTARTARVPNEGALGTTVTINTYNATATSASTSTSITAAGSAIQVADRIMEGTISSGSLQTGVLYTLWNPLATSTVLYYKDVAGVCRVASFPTVWKTMP